MLRVAAALRQRVGGHRGHSATVNRLQKRIIHKSISKKSATYTRTTNGTINKAKEKNACDGRVYCKKLPPPADANTCNADLF